MDVRECTLFWEILVRQLMTMSWQPNNTPTIHVFVYSEQPYLYSVLKSTGMEPKPNKVKTSSETDFGMEEDAQKVSTECTDDFGLRRRQVSPTDAIKRKWITGDFHHHAVSESYGKHTEEYDRPKETPERSKQHGGASRIILHNTMDERSLPHKLKKSKISKDSYTPFVNVRDGSADVVEQTVTLAPRKGLSILLKKGWITGDTVRNKEQAYFLFAMRDFILFIVFLVLLCFAVYGHRVSSYNYYATQMLDILSSLNYKSFLGTYEVTCNFQTIHAISQIWGFVFQVLVPTRAFLGTEESDNKIIGSSIIRQLRVKNNTCSTAPMFADLYVTCYDYYTESNEDKEPFGNINSSVWRYTPDIDSITMHGEIGSYGAGGYLYNMSSDFKFMLLGLKEMEALSWIRLGTRAIICDMTMYAPDTNLFLSVKLIFEFYPTGGVAVKPKLVPLNLLKYQTPWHLFVMSCELMVILYTLYYTFEELQQIYELREEYFANLWNILDLTIIFLSYCTIYLGIRSQYLTRKLLIPKLEEWHSDSHVSFDDIHDAESKFMLSQSFLVFAAVQKLFKFTPLFKSVTYIMAAFEKIRSGLVTVVLMSFILISGFALCGICLFGAHVKDFQSFPMAAFSLISMQAGSLGFYSDCRRAYPILAPIYFSVYILMSVVIFFAVFVALIAHGYNIADTYMQQRPDSEFFGDLVWAFLITILAFFSKFEYIKKLEKKAMISQNQEDYDAFVRVLQRHGCRELELKLLMNKYHFERGKAMHLEKMADMYNDLCLRKILIVEVEGHNSIHQHLDKIDKMSESCDQAIVDIMTKLDYLSKFRLLGKRRADRESV